MKKLTALFIIVLLSFNVQAQFNVNKLKDKAKSVSVKEEKNPIQALTNHNHQIQLNHINKRKY